MLLLPVDSDYCVADLAHLWSGRAHADVLVGAQPIEPQATDDSPLRRHASWLAGLLCAWLTKGPRHGLDSDVVLASRSVLQRIDAAGTWQERHGAVLRLLVAAARGGASIQEVALPVARASADRAGLAPWPSVLWWNLTAALQLWARRPTSWQIQLWTAVAAALMAGLAVHTVWLHRGQLRSHLALACSWAMAALTVSLAARTARVVAIARIHGWRLRWRDALRDLALSRMTNEILPIRVGDLVRLQRAVQRQDQAPWEATIQVIVAEKWDGLWMGVSLVACHGALLTPICTPIRMALGPVWSAVVACSAGLLLTIAISELGRAALTTLRRLAARASEIGRAHV